MSSQLLSREKFQAAVFARDNGTCVFCDAPAVDAHHVFDRKLFPDNGYYLDNGASVCADHHMACEETRITVEEVWKACGITEPVIPSQLERGQSYDKWGNPILPDGRRMRGEMFFEDGVQKILQQAGFLPLFTHYVKYPRTPHLPFSPGASPDDRILDTLRHFAGRRVIATVKKDGENTTLYQDHLHARSLDSRHHPSRDWIKAFWSTVRWDIPQFWRLCGENLFARHSIAYDDLASYFYGFSVWNERNVALSWDETLEWFQLIGHSAGTAITPVEVAYDGPFEERQIQALCEEVVKAGEEGLVLRLADEIAYRNFDRSVAKYVRPHHVTTDKHWMHAEIVPNGLSGT